MNNRLDHPLQQAIQNGFAIFPLVGGSDLLSGKKPAVPWKKYQTQLPTPIELQQWFGTNLYSAYAIVCGLVSGLIVLDFDDAALFANFAAHFPHLLNTKIVQSRRGFHVYWRVNFTVQGRRLCGADLKAEGGYVVGPGSEIGGATWTVFHDGPILGISENQLAEVSKFFDPPLARIPLPSLTLFQSPDDAVQMYQAAVKREQGQRNFALFQTACLLRDTGYGEAWTFETLADAHVHQPTRRDHGPETPAQRYQEARATIASAYRRPPRSTDDSTASRLPNSVREALLKLPNGVLALRLIEGVNLSPLRAEKSFTISEAATYLKGCLSRAAISRALQVATSNGNSIFGVYGSKSAFVKRCPTETNAFVSISFEGWLSASQGERVGRERGYHRPAQHYTCPTIPELCQLLGVKLVYGDPMTPDDLQSNRAYRAALNQKLIKRRRGKYSQYWLAQRLNVSDRTIRRYLKADPYLHSAPTCTTLELSRSTLGYVPYGADWQFEDTGGRFLLNARRKALPCKREIAERYLKAGQRIWLVEQGPNLYWYAVDDKTPPPTEDYQVIEKGLPAEHIKKRQSKGLKNTDRTDRKKSIEPIQKHSSNGSDNVDRTPPPRSTPATPVSVETPIMYVKDITPPAEERLSKRRQLSQQRQYRYALDDETHESAAQAIYADMKQVATPQHSLSLANARRLVDTFGPSIVRKQAAYILKLHKQGKTTNPVGLLIVNVEAAWVRLNSWTPFGGKNICPPPRREFKAQPKRGSRGEKAITAEAPYNFEHELATNPIYQDEAYLCWRLNWAREHEGAAEYEIWQDRLNQAIYAHFLKRVETDPLYQDEAYLRWRVNLAYESCSLTDIRFWEARLVKLGFEPPRLTHENSEVECEWEYVDRLRPVEDDQCCI